MGVTCSTYGGEQKCIRGSSMMDTSLKTLAQKVRFGLFCCYLGCSVIIVLFYVLIVCTVTLPPGVKPIAVDKYIYLSIYLQYSSGS